MLRLMPMTIYLPKLLSVPQNFILAFLLLIDFAIRGPVFIVYKSGQCTSSFSWRFLRYPVGEPITYTMDLQ